MPRRHFGYPKTSRFAEARKACLAYHCILTRSSVPGEYILVPDWIDPIAKEDCSYFTTDLDDAIATAKAEYSKAMDYDNAGK